MVRESARIGLTLSATSKGTRRGGAKSIPGSRLTFYAKEQLRATTERRLDQALLLGPFNRINPSFKPKILQASLFQDLAESNTHRLIASPLSRHRISSTNPPVDASPP
jgi:hypothetical protein